MVGVTGYVIWRMRDGYGTGCKNGKTVYDVPSSTAREHKRPAMELEKACRESLMFSMSASSTHDDVSTHLDARNEILYLHISDT